MPCWLVPIQSAFSRSRSNCSTATDSPFNSDDMKGLQIPRTSCCSPRPGPELAMPTHKDPSRSGAKEAIPSIPAFDFNPLGLYMLCDCGFQRTKLVEPPIQKSPRLSSVMVESTLAGIPSSFPWHRIPVPTISHRGAASAVACVRTLECVIAIQTDPDRD